MKHTPILMTAAVAVNSIVTHLNEVVGFVGGALTAAYWAVKLYVKVRKEFFPKTRKPKHATETVDT